MATQRIRYVNAAADAGGDGTTNALTGPNCAYQNPRDGHLAEAGDIVSSDEYVTFRWEGSTAFGVINFNTGSLWVTDADHYVEHVCEGANHHEGVWDTNKPRVSGPIGAGAIRLNDCQHIRFRGIQVENTGSSGLTGVAGIAITNTGTGVDARVEECLVRATGSPTSFGTGINFSGGTSGQQKAANNIVYGFLGGSSGTGIGCFSTGPSFQVYANTVTECRTGINKTTANGTNRLKGNLLYNLSDIAVANGANFDEMDYCATDAASFGAGVPSGTGNLTSTVVTFEDQAGKDFTLDPADTGVQNMGTDLSGDATYPITRDVTGTTRTGTWEIGAYNIPGGGVSGTGLMALAGFSLGGTGTVGSGGGGVPPFLFRRRR